MLHFRRLACSAWLSSGLLFSWSSSLPSFLWVSLASRLPLGFARPCPSPCLLGRLFGRVVLVVGGALVVCVCLNTLHVCARLLLLRRRPRVFLCSTVLVCGALSARPGVGWRRRRRLVASGRGGREPSLWLAWQQASVGSVSLGSVFVALPADLAWLGRPGVSRSPSAGVAVAAVGPHWFLERHSSRHPIFESRLVDTFLSVSEMRAYT